MNPIGEPLKSLLQKSFDLWNDIAENGYTCKYQSKFYEKYNIGKYQNECPLCELYRISLLHASICLPDCPLIKDGKTCYDIEHPFRIWWLEDDISGAEKIRDMIKTALKAETRET